MLVAMLVAVLMLVFLGAVVGFGLLVFMGFFFFQVACILMLMVQLAVDFFQGKLAS